MIRRLTSTLAGLLAQSEARRAMRQLARLDDGLLRDLGIHRADIPTRVLGVHPRL